MVGGTRIIAFGSGSQQPDDDEFLLSEELVPTEAEQVPLPQDEAEPPVARLPWLAPTLAFLAVLGWTAFFLWAKFAQIAALPDPSAGTALVSEWAMPVALIGVAWLLAMRNSRREAMRFGNTAALLADEAIRLEQRLTVVNRELSLAREFIAAQGRDLDSLGRLAVERMSSSAERLEALVQENGSRLESLGTVSESALDNMEKLRSQLPVIASSAKDVTNNIGNAGRTAHNQLAQMISGFRQLNTFGQASEQQVATMREQVSAAIAEFTGHCEKLETVVAERFVRLTEQGSEFRSQLEAHEIAALAAVRTRAAALAEELAQTRSVLDTQEGESLTSLRARLSALRDESSAISRSIRDGEARALESWGEAIGRIEGELSGAIAALVEAESRAADNARARIDTLLQDASALEAQLAEQGQSFASEVGRRRQELEAGEQAAIAGLLDRLGTLDAAIEERRAGHERQTAAILAHSQAITAELADLERRLGELASRTGTVETGLASSAQALLARLDEASKALTGTDREIADLTDAGVRLLEILQASKLQTGVELPEALAEGEQRLAAFETRVAALGGAIASAGDRGEALAGLIATSQSELRAVADDIAALQVTLESSSSAQGEVLAGLRRSLAEVGSESTRLYEQANGELSQAIERLLSSAGQAVETINKAGSEAVAELAEELGGKGAEAIEKGMQAAAGQVAGQLEEVTANAARVSRDAAIQLRDQLVKVNELVGHLERRVAQTRERAEEQVDNDFSRRAALITESLNSNAIDIAKALSTDVADTAWAAYLRGDRGIFTRRAVTLVEAGDAKAIAQIFEHDREFREHVSRYIHDFEAILRQVLSTRDGHALGVTLLSSDMGKLYVALAQAIERLRR